MKLISSEVILLSLNVEFELFYKLAGTLNMFARNHEHHLV